MGRRGRQPNGRPRILAGVDKRTGIQKYSAFVTVGTKPNGEPLRKHIERNTQQEVVDAIDELQRRQKQSPAAAAGKIETVGQWLDHYLEEIIRPSRPQTTWRSYRSLVDRHVLPVIGAKRLAGTAGAVLEPEHVDAVYNRMRRTGGRSGKGMAPSSILKVHRILVPAGDVAVRRGKASRNVFAMVDPPESRKRKSRKRAPEGYDFDDAQKLLAEAARDSMEARWLLGLLLGPRQGEALGVRWSRLRLLDDEPTLNLIQQIQRYTWQHGCEDPVGCAALRCRRKPCGPSWEHGCTDEDACRKNPRFCPDRRGHPCRRHSVKRGCPDLCRPGCVRHAARCPERVDGGLVEVDLKTERSERTLPLPPVVVSALERRREAQMREAHARGDLWDDHGLVFTRPDGRPVDPRQDYEAWRGLARRAGVPVRRLHAARHSAASLLIATGSKLSEVQELLGHADVRTTRGYVEVAAKLKVEAVTRLADALFNGQLAHLIQQNPTTADPGR